MTQFLKLIAAVVLISSITCASHADNIAFSNLTQSDFEDILRDISGAWSYTSVTGASSLGHLFGFEAGIEAGTAKTPKVDSLSQAAGETSIPSLPFAALFGAVTVPFGITVETSFYPQATVSGVTAKYGALAVKWTFSELLDLPVDLAAKVYGSRSDYSFSGTVSGTATTIDLDDTVSGLELQVSKKFLFVEPYFNIGVVRAKGDMNASGTAPVFNTSYTATNSASETVSGSMFAVGADLNLLFFRLGLEVGKVFENTKIAGKLSVYF